MPFVSKIDALMSLRLLAITIHTHASLELSVFPSCVVLTGSRRAQETRTRRAPNWRVIAINALCHDHRGHKSLVLPTLPQPFSSRLPALLLPSPLLWRHTPLIPHCIYTHLSYSLAFIPNHASSRRRLSRRRLYTLHIAPARGKLLATN